MTDDDRQPMPGPWTDIAQRPTPYDDYTASLEGARTLTGMRGLKDRAPRAARALGVLALVFGALVVAAVALEPPWADAGTELGVVSEAEARQAFDEMVALASQQSLGAWSSSARTPWTTAPASRG